MFISVVFAIALYFTLTWLIWFARLISTLVKNESVVIFSRHTLFVVSGWTLFFYLYKS